MNVFTYHDIHFKTQGVQVIDRKCKRRDIDDKILLILLLWEAISPFPY